MINNAQNTGYTFKAGPSMGFQKWANGGKRAPMFAYHAAFGIDSESSDGKNIIYGQLGYHVKGGAIRYSFFIDQFGNRIKGDKFNMKFYNAVLEIGVKRTQNTFEDFTTYFGVGARAELTTNQKFEFNTEYIEWVRKFNYGLSFLGGIEYSLGKTIRNGWELRIAPDISKQIFVPAGTLWYDPFSRTSYRGSEISTRNLTIELSTYIRLLQIIEYVD